MLMRLCDEGMTDEYNPSQSFCSLQASRHSSRTS